MKKQNPTSYVVNSFISNNFIPKYEYIFLIHCLENVDVITEIKQVELNSYKYCDFHNQILMNTVA